MTKEGCSNTTTLLRGLYDDLSRFGELGPTPTSLPGKNMETPEPGLTTTVLYDPGLSRGPRLRSVTAWRLKPRYTETM